ncbi:MAG: hypothetical protein FWB88_06040 [Defluviitaleaceae bacterium]|nr:hypothetical protein [Defluviitaleaceae bacterium]MCL2238570.1 hypothetical protein [Defluviitaleaceae bacterium]
MNLHKIRFHPIIGLVALFFAFSLLGIILSFAYQAWMGSAYNIAARVFAPVLFGAGLGGAVFGLKRLFKVTWGFLAFLCALGGCAVVYALMWEGFPLRGEVEAFAILEREIPGLAMQAIWALEAAAIALPPLYMALRRAGIYLPGYNRWAQVRLMDYGFKPFTDTELDRLAAGETEIFMKKPIDLTGLNRIHAVGLCYVDKRLTEYLAVFKANWDRQGNMEKGPLLLLAAMPIEKIEDLQGVLYEIHRESESED